MQQKETYAKYAVINLFGSIHLVVFSKTVRLNLKQIKPKEIWEFRDRKYCKVSVLTNAFIVRY